MCGLGALLYYILRNCTLKFVKAFESIHNLVKALHGERNLGLFQTE